MFPKYYQQELLNLREQGAEFAKSHPALAPMLSGARADPDTERLLEGSAFLTALLRQKLDDEFPEIVHDLLQIVAPQYLNPFPAATIQAFKPKATVRHSVKLPAGIYCASVPVDGVSCHFKTCYPVEIHPLTITDANFSHAPGRPPIIKLSFELNGLSLAQWKPESLRLFLADDFSKAADLYLLLRRHLKAIHLKAEGGVTQILPASRLQPVGFQQDERLVPTPTHAYPGFSVLQEYFVLPQKFLFLDIVGWSDWKTRGTSSSFEVLLELDSPPTTALRVNKDSFVLHATPAINLFPHEADPIYLDHRKTQYPIRPAGLSTEQYQIQSVDEVRGFIQGTSQERKYVPFDLFHPSNPTNPVYQLSRRPSPVHVGADMYLSINYTQQEGLPSPETLSLQLTCTNGQLPGRLKAGDITVHAKGCPEYVTFQNLIAPTPGLPSPLGKNLLWRLLSHLSIGFQTLENVDTLKSLLELYINPDDADPTTLANQKRIDGIFEMLAAPSDRLVSGIVMRGRELTLKVREDHFSGRGDLFLFGCVLDTCFANYASINSFTALNFKETTGGQHYSWPARMGNRRLI